MYKLKIFLIVATMLGLGGKLQAQLNPFTASYFQNHYLINPAWAGANKSLNVNLGYKNHTGGITNSSTMMYGTGDYGFKDKMGAGLTVVSDLAGSIRTNELRGSYAIHIPTPALLDGNVHVGFSVFATQYRLDNKLFAGDPSDPLIVQYNNRPIDINATFGAGFSSDKLTVSASVPNLVNFFKKDYSDRIDRSMYFGMASYKITSAKDRVVGVEPVVAVRGFSGFDPIIDAGSKFSFADNEVYGMLLWHSTRNMSAGVGIDIMKNLLLTANYTSPPNQMSSINTGFLEFGFRFTGLNKD